MFASVTNKTDAGLLFEKANASAGGGANGAIAKPN